MPKACPSCEEQPPPHSYQWTACLKCRENEIIADHQYCDWTSHRGLTFQVHKSVDQMFSTVLIAGTPTKGNDPTFEGCPGPTCIH